MDFRKALLILRNKYLLVTIFFVVWIVFFDRNDLISRRSTEKEIARMEDNRSFYKEEVKSLKKFYQQLQNDPIELERFAREQYYMHKADEDLYIILEE